MDRLRFPAPLPVGAEFRGVAEIGEVKEVRGGVQVAMKLTVEVRAPTSPRCRGLPLPVLRMRLDGKVAIVTGAARGLGRAYAEALLAAGADVVVNDVDEAVREVARVAEVCPVGSTEAADSLVERAVSEFGRLDIMVTNAGVLRDKVLWKMSDDDFDTVAGHPPARHVHLRAGGGRSACAPRRRAGGSSSSARPRASTATSARPTTARPRPGIVAFARTWAMELARAQITVNAIVPTAWTRMTASIPLYAPLVGPRRVPARGAPGARAGRARRTARRWSSSCPPTRPRA